MRAVKILKLFPGRSLAASSREVSIKKIVILTHENSPLSSLNYFIRVFIDIWQEQGIEVQEVCGAERFVPADAALLHIDLTRIPEEYLQLAGRYPIALNRGAVDVGKRTTSDYLVSRGDGYLGPVIVKTHCNAGGGSEARLGKRGIAGFWWSGVRNWAAWRLSSPSLIRQIRQISPYRYPVFDSARDVPDAVFENPNLVVERFLPEIIDGYYCTRTALICGDKVCYRRSRSTSRIVKTRSTNSAEYVDDPLAPTTAWRRQTGLDYGKFDYTIYEGKPALIDVNRTPIVGRRLFRPGVVQLATQLSAGILTSARRAA